MSATSDQDLERWRALVERGLKGAPFDSLVAETLEGLEIQPLYTERDRPAEEGIPWAPRSPRLVGPAGPVAILAHPAASIGSALWVWGWADDSRPVEREGQIVLAPCTPTHALVELGSSAFRPVVDPWSHEVINGRASMLGSERLDPLARAVASGRPCLGTAGWQWNWAGANAVEELAFTLASLIESLRGLEKRGCDLEAAVEGSTVATSSGPELFLEIAKLRAYRRLLDRAISACGIRARPWLVATTSARLAAQLDRPTNLIRQTVAVAAALVGGADVVCCFPYEQVAPTSTRIASLVPQVLTLESSLHAPSDPAHGSFYVEHLTAALARDAWQLFREIESGGGLVASWQVARDRRVASAERREREVCTRRRPLVGVSRFPTREAARQGGPYEDACPFETLRYRAQGYVSRVITVGACPPARVDFAREILAISGLPDTVHAFTDDAAAALGDASIVILAGPDAALAVETPAVARALKSAGAKAIGVAGKPGAHEAALRDAGVDAFVFVGADVVTFAETLLERAKGAASS